MGILNAVMRPDATFGVLRKSHYPSWGFLTWVHGWTGKSALYIKSHYPSWGFLTGKTLLEEEQTVHLTIPHGDS